MANEKIIESTIALNQTWLSREEEEAMYDLLSKYKGKLCLIEKIVTC